MGFIKIAIDGTKFYKQADVFCMKRELVSMKVYIEKENRLLELDRECSGLQLLKELDINPATVLIVRNDEVVLPEEGLSGTDDIKILSVVSGG